MPEKYRALALSSGMKIDKKTDMSFLIYKPTENWGRWTFYKQ